jgi:hypothetical protein
MGSEARATTTGQDGTPQPRSCNMQTHKGWEAQWVAGAGIGVQVLFLRARGMLLGINAVARFEVNMRTMQCHACRVCTHLPMDSSSCE